MAGVILLEFSLLDLLPGYVESFDRVVNQAAEAMNRPSDLVGKALYKLEARPLITLQAVIALFLHNH